MLDETLKIEKNAPEIEEFLNRIDLAENYNNPAALTILVIPGVLNVSNLDFQMNHDSN